MERPARGGGGAALPLPGEMFLHLSRDYAPWPCIVSDLRVAPLEVQSLFEASRPKGRTAGTVDDRIVVLFYPTARA